MYQRGSIYYARFSQLGTDTMRSLKTDHFQTAKLALTTVQRDVEGARQAGHTLSGTHRTMAGLEREAVEEIANSRLSQASKDSYGFTFKRLRKAWPQEFDSTVVRGIDRRFILRVRTNMAAYLSPSSVNRSLAVLKRMLDLAVSRNVISESPFTAESVLRDSILLPLDTRVPELPSSEDMERIFAEMEKPILDDTLDELQVERRILAARKAGEHARFLAYSGMRLQEATASDLADDLGQWILVRGTKTETAARKIPVIRELRVLMDKIRARRVGGQEVVPGDVSRKFLEIQTCRRSLQRACRKLKLPVLTHHDLRHYFASVCIESGAGIPTVADWLGHADGGKLLLKTYRHLRNAHSLAGAAKVSFSATTPAAPQPGVSSCQPTPEAIPA